MLFSSIFLQNPSKTLHNRLIFLRRMGGGPRTFPGGLNKWQWKRMHEKKAREKEKRLLDQEKQVYQARIRSEIRAKVASADNPIAGPEKPDQNQPNYAPVTPQDHIKAVADRFMKEGAEDLWNEDDGPSKIPKNKPGRSQIIGEPIDLQKMIAKRSSFSGGDAAKPRSFSTYTRQSCNLMDDFRNYNWRTMNNGFNLVDRCRHGISMDVSNVLNIKRQYSVGAVSTASKGSNFARNGQSSGGGGRARWPRFRGRAMNSSDDDSDDYGDDEEEEELENSKKNLRSSAALGKYDIKKKRVPLNFLEDEVDLSEQVEAIRKEINERKSMMEDEREKGKEESLLSTKRFDECDVSSLTVQALTEAGYVQMTRVQEATLSACLEGKDALVKARAGTGKSIAFLF